MKRKQQGLVLKSSIGKNEKSDSPLIPKEKKNNACKPSSVSRLRGLPSFIYATYPPGPDGPSFNAEGKK